MLNSVIRFALRYRVLVVFMSLAVLCYGGFVTARLPLDVFPDLDRPRVVVMTEAPGMAPAEVETLITAELEAAFLGANGVQAVRSQSDFGLSAINIEFDWGTDIHRARQTVQERLTSAQAALPPGIRPQMGPISSIMGQIVSIGMYRRTGPNGGELAPVGATGMLAELVHDPRTGRVAVYLWQTRDKANARLEEPAAWQPVTAADVTLTWPKDSTRAQASNNSLTLLPHPGQAGSFGSEDDQLRTAGLLGPFRDLERRVGATVNGRRLEAIFPPTVKQLMELRTIADWIVRPQLLKIPGVAQVTVLGGGRKQYQVLADQDALVRYDVSLHQVEEALRRSNLNASGGIAVQGDKEQPIRILGRLGPRPDEVLRELEQVVVKPLPTRSVVLAQVARAVEAPAFKRGDASVNGQPGVLLSITKQPHHDTRDLTRKVTAVLAEIERSQPADVVISPEVFQMKGFIDRAVYNVGEALVIGAALVLLVLFLFLMNFRTTFISLAAIPLSLVITGLTFKVIGWLTGSELSINVMTLGGIAVAMGELVDDAIVDVENIFRRLRENNALPQPRPALSVIYHASVEVRSAIVFGTVTVILVFVPLFALSGIEGRLFVPLGVAYIVSILASLLVSLTVTPVLSYYLLPRAPATHRRQDSWLLRGLKGAATPLIRLSMAWPGTLLLAGWVLVAGSVFVLTRLGADFLPSFDEGSVQVNVTLPAGSSLEASEQTARIVDERFRTMQRSPQNPDGVIVRFARRSGRAELDEHVEPVGNTEYILTIAAGPESGRQEVLRRILDDLKENMPGADLEVDQPLNHMISHMLSGVTSQIAIKVQGDDLDVLRRTAEKVQAAVRTVPGVTTPVIEAQGQSGEIHVQLRPEQLELYGLDRTHVADRVAVALQGEVVSQVVDGTKRFDLLVRLDERFRKDQTDLARLRIDLPAGSQVPLGELAYVTQGSGPNTIKRENARRRLVVRCNALGRDLAGAVAEIKERVRDEVALPPGYSVEYGGQFESQQEATRLIVGLALLSLGGIFAVLYVLFPSPRIVLQVLNALPAAFVGGVLALALTGQSLTVAAMVGFISLGGIAVRNGILLVTHYLHLMRYEGEGFTPQMVLRGSLERLSPVLMTALTAGIGLLPLVLGGQQSGREILYPVATVILGGLITSTLCEFLIHPGLFWRFSGQDAERLTRSPTEAGSI